jgi:hypothetical protein
MGRADAENDVARRWTEALRQFLPGFAEEHEALGCVWERATALLHGSTTMGIDDACSDLDLCLLLFEEDLAAFDALSDTRFIQFELDGKAGHLIAEALPEFEEQIASCHMDTIHQLRRARTVHDGGGCAERLLAEVRRPMRPEVSRALFFWHYTEMRSEHRACDTPIVRGQEIALLLALSKTLAHAMQAAIVLEGEPYPFDKWLHRAALGTPTGRALEPHVQAILDCLAADGLRERHADEDDHLMTVELRAIRRILIDAARGRGIDEPWLESWWLYMTQAREAFGQLRW